MIILVIISAFGALANQSEAERNGLQNKINHLHANFTSDYYISFKNYGLNVRIF